MRAPVQKSRPRRTGKQTASGTGAERTPATPGAPDTPVGKGRPTHVRTRLILAVAVVAAAVAGAGAPSLVTASGELNDSQDLVTFAEQTQDALYSQTIFDDAANRNVSRVQNIELIRTRGIEAALSGSDVGMRGLDLNASVTYTRSFIEKNDGFVTTPGDTIGKWQPNIPRWRATATATWRFDPDLSASVGLRYSGKQYRTLDNSDVNGFTYMGVSPYFTTDLRLRWRPARQWTVALGIDNLNNYRYWNFHPYPQRSYSAELKWDL